MPGLANLWRCRAAAANIAVGLVRLGVPTAFAGRFSRAGFGPWLRSYLVANGLDLALSVDAEEDATLALVTLDGQGRASYTFYGPGTADWQWDATELPDLTAAAPADLGISRGAHRVHCTDPRAGCRGLG